MLRSLSILGLLLSGGIASAASIEVNTTPAVVVLGQVDLVTIRLRGLPGSAPVRVATNVGAVEEVTEAGEEVRLRYRPPAQGFPQQLCLLLWRAKQRRILVLRIPLLGNAVVPIKTRRNSQVTLTVGGRVFGPKPSGTHGRLEMQVVVPPGTSTGQVEVVDEVGLATTKPVEVRIPPYNLLAMAVRPGRSAAPAPRFQVTVATAVPQSEVPRVQVTRTRAGPGARPGAILLGVEPESAGRYSASWIPDRRPDSGEWVVRAWLPGSPSSTQTSSVTVLPLPRPEVAAKPSPVAAPASSSIRKRAPPARRRSKLRLNAALAAGMMSNTGDLLGPRLAAELGGDYALGPGRIGLRLSAGVTWASQSVQVADSLDASRAQVLLFPLGLQLTYRLPLGRFAPYAAAGLLAQIVRSGTDGQHTGQSNRVDGAMGFLGLVGGDLTLGPGAVFLQTGYMYSRLNNDDLELLAGGIFLEGGYRIEFGI